MRIGRRFIAATAILLTFLGGCGEQTLPPDAGVTNKASDPAQDGSPFKCDFEVQAGGPTTNTRVFFDSHYAVEFDPEDPSAVDAVYDLGAMSWRDFSPPRTVWLKDREARRRGSEKNLREVLAKTGDARLRQFVELTREPKFKVVEKDGTITLKNEAFTFRLSDPLPLNAAQRKRFFAYDRLSSWRKQTGERQLGPFVQRAVDDEMEARAFAPGAIALTLGKPGGDIDITVRVRESSLTTDELGRVAKAIAASGTPPK